MNFISGPPVLALADNETGLTLEAAHIWRSKIVDKCAEAERHVLRLLRSGGGSWPAKAPMSQKVECLKKMIGPADGARDKARILALLERLEPLSDLRTELVHSTISISEVEGQKVAILRNAAETSPFDQCRIILSAARLKSEHKLLSNIANSLKQEAEAAEKSAGPTLSRE